MTRFFLLILFLCGLSILSAQTTINPCAANQPMHVVVLGSSTAAGTGPSSPDSTWVNRYRKYLQQINPSNLVTNLALGGRTTYHILPDGFVPPAGRPLPITTNNISEAIRLGADAVIVNMPSNDAANNFSREEQMNNFRTISAHADSAGVPTWICTTQPRNFSAAQRAVQLEVKDSVLAYFGSRSIDFWTGFADSTLGLGLPFDSGDGVHMNDTAHAILMNRTVEVAIPNALTDTLSYEDYLISTFETDDIPLCGDAAIHFSLNFHNQGIMDLAGRQLNIHIQEQVGLYDSTLTVSLSPLSACKADSFSFEWLIQGGEALTFVAYFDSAEADLSNDTSTILSISLLEGPALVPSSDSVCVGGMAVLEAQSNDPSHHIFWYTDSSKAQLLGEGGVLILDSVLENEEVYVQSIQGNLYFDRSLSTTTQSNISFNGMMFDLIAHDSLVIDSLAFKAFDVGAQWVSGFYRRGSYQGYEQDPSSWLAWGQDLVDVAQSDDFTTIAFSSISLQEGDTLGVYLHLNNANRRLRYNSSSQFVSYQDSQLEIRSGAGIAHTFGAIFSPRLWNGEVFYHHGSRPEGDCQSPIYPAEAIINIPMIDLGPDTTVLLGSQFFPANSSQIVQYFWSNGDTTPFLTLDSARYRPGLYAFWVEGYDRNGCSAVDSILLDIQIPTSSELTNFEATSIYPNPAQDRIFFKGNHSPLTWISIYDLQGKKVISKPLAGNSFFIGHLNKGMYIVKVNGETASHQFPLMKD
ncbi:MAG: SGNH/GDSL hydrolase family protein [Bacteroidota bacterium]